MKLRITMEHDTHDVEVLNADRVRWDMHATKNGWPSFTKAPFLGITFLAWAAAKRLGLYAQDFDTFSSHDCLDVEALDVDVDDEEVNALGKSTETTM